MFKKVYALSSQQKLFPPLYGKKPRIWSDVYYKTYPRFPLYTFPSPQPLPMALSESIMKRRSSRKKTEGGKHRLINLNELSHILYYSAGINCLPNTRCPYPKRVYPSAGARYPLEIYLMIKNQTQEIPSGTFHYNVQAHALEQLPVTLTNHLLIHKVFGTVNKNIVLSSGVMLFISAVFQRTEIKYGNPSFKYICFEAGHMMQNVLLCGTSLGIKTCVIGGFNEDALNSLFFFDKNKELMLYACSLMT